MSVAFANPPLIEALCDFRFVPDRPWDGAIPGLVYAEIRSEFPNRQQQQPTLQLQFGSAELQTPFGDNSRVQFVRDDQSAMVQIGTDHLVINQVRPYQTWDRFRELIFSNFEAYVRVAAPKAASRIGLRYINKIEVPQPSPGIRLSISDYMATAPGLPETLRNGTIANFIQRVEMIVPEYNGILVLQSATVPADRQEYFAFLLDLDFITNLSAPMPLDQVRDWIDRAHTRIEDAFMECITAKARQLFEEVLNV